MKKKISRLCFSSDLIYTSSLEEKAKNRNKSTNNFKQKERGKKTDTEKPKESKKNT